MDALTAVLDALDPLLPGLEADYKDLHAHPELAFQEKRTAALVAERLAAQGGWEVTTGVGRTGVVGVLRNGEGPVVMLRADMDALPVKEATGLPYASTVTATDDSGTEVPVMHACGHDMHVAALIGACALLAARTDHWKGTVVAVFQPGRRADTAPAPWSTTVCSSASRTRTSSWGSTSAPAPSASSPPAPAPSWAPRTPSP